MTVLPFSDMSGPPEERRRIGRYEVKGIIGSGSMGTVYLAHDPLIGREVAIKTLSARLRPKGRHADTLRHQLLNEAASAGALSHPGIVTVHDVIDDGRDISIAMEYVSGETLKQRLAQATPMSMASIVSVVTEIAEVLDFAHERGVVHRDIKPANVVLAEQGRLRITDFGIASLRGRDLASDLQAMGTPSYLAPERIMGEPADHRGDLYSLGVVLYEMLTGHLPYPGASVAELVSNAVQQEPTPPETYRPDLPAGIRAVLDRALRKDPDERYQTAGELASELAVAARATERKADTQPITRVIQGPAAPAPAGSGLGPLAAAGSILRRRWLLVAAAGVIVAAGALAVAALLSGPPPIPPDATGPQQPAADGDARQRQVAYLALLAEVQELYQAGEVAAAERLIDAAAAEMPEAVRIRELRRQAWWETETERATLQVAQRVELLAAAEEALARGDLGTADAALYKLRQIDPGNAEAVELRAALNTALRRNRVVRRAPPPPPTEPEPAAAERYQPFALDTPPAAPPVEAVGSLKIDFQSQLPRGVLTVYLEGEQILRREYRFVERRGLFRRRATSGGFDLSRKLDAGPLELKVYVALPGRPTRSGVARGELPGGSSRTLAIRVDRKGDLQLDFH